jgi:hypothetical protein
MKIEQYRMCRIQFIQRGLLAATLAIGPIALSGCRGTPLQFPQSLSGLGSATRVPPPATGSFQVPGSYSGPNANPTGLGSSSFAPANGTTSPNTLKTSQVNQPVSDFVNSVSAAQSQFRTATNNALSTVNRTAADVNSRVENATSRVDRLGEGVKQASAILTEAASAPLPPSLSDSGSTSGRISDNATTAPSTWRTPGQP